MERADVNLLPWREQRDQRLRRNLLLKIVACALLCLSIWLSCEQWIGTLKQETAQNQTALQQGQTQLQQIERQINQFRANVQQPQNQPEMDSALAIAVLQQIAKLPFNQGELSELQLRQNQLILTGNSESQEEFNQLHQFLRQQGLFAEIKLAQFKPRAQDIAFQFELRLKDQFVKEKE